MTAGQWRFLTILALATGAAAVAAVLSCRSASSIPDGAAPVGRAPKIRPDYAGVTIPANIAPMNFLVDEDAVEVRARIAGSRGDEMLVAGSGAGIIIPAGKWRDLLERNRGGEVRITIYARDSAGRWRVFDPIVNHVANEDIDSHLVYRLINPSAHNWENLGLYQRDVRNFEETELVHRHAIRDGCVNCHTFLNNRPDTFLFHVRSSSASYRGGMILVRNGVVSKLDVRSMPTSLPTAYSSWHPDGRIVAQSINRIMLFLHGAGAEIRDQIDLGSDITTLDVDARTLTSPAPISDPQALETFPAWSPDGKSLYFCSTVPRWPDPMKTTRLPEETYRSIKYDLMRVSYDSAGGPKAWGKPELVLSSTQAKGSILEPRISPDGRYLMFCLCEYGNVPVFQPGAALCLLDLSSKDKDWRPMKEANSGQCESWHCWSSNGRWFVFSSKRGDGLFSRPYLSYFDTTGREHKPFILPQEDPAFYDTNLRSYNIPELITGPVPVTERQLVDAILHGGPPEAVNAEPPGGSPTMH